MRADAHAACPPICPHHPPTQPSPTLAHHLSPAQSLVSCTQGRVHACVHPPTLIHPAHLQTHDSERAHDARARPPTYTWATCSLPPTPSSSTYHASIRKTAVAHPPTHLPTASSRACALARTRSSAHPRSPAHLQCGNAARSQPSPSPLINGTTCTCTLCHCTSRTPAPVAAALTLRRRPHPSSPPAIARVVPSLLFSSSLPSPLTLVLTLPV